MLTCRQTQLRGVLVGPAGLRGLAVEPGDALNEHADLHGLLLGDAAMPYDGFFLAFVPPRVAVYETGDQGIA